MKYDAHLTYDVSDTPTENHRPDFLKLTAKNIKTTILRENDAT